MLNLMYMGRWRPTFISKAMLNITSWNIRCGKQIRSFLALEPLMPMSVVIDWPCYVSSNIICRYAR